MKFGTLYSYWTNEWSSNYLETAKRVRDLGFDILEIGANHLVEMPEKELIELGAVVRDLGLTVTSNIGPKKKYDVASADPDVRKAGIRYLCDIMKKMDQIDSRSLVGVTYTYWPNDFSDLDKDAIWARGVQSVKQTGAFACDLGICQCLEVVNRFETLVLYSAEEAVRFCVQVVLDNVKVLMDTVRPAFSTPQEQKTWQ